jgi:hypothetical protein
MEYTRIYGDSDGESHFEDVTVELSPVDFAPPAPPLNLASPMAADRVVLGAAERAGSEIGIRLRIASLTSKCPESLRSPPATVKCANFRRGAFSC